MSLKYGLYDYVELKHNSKYWKIIRVGMDIKVKSLNDNKILKFNRRTFEQEVKRVINFNPFITEKNIVLFNGSCICPNCGHNHANLIQDSTNEHICLILCNQCNLAHAFYTTRNDILNVARFQKTLNHSVINNTKYNTLLFDPNRLTINNYLYNDIGHLIYDSESIFKLELINSTNNHVTKKHNIQTKFVKIAYKTSINKYKYFTYNCLYCEDCNCYFDFYHSFISQLTENKIDINSLIIKLLKTEIYFDTLDEQHLLNFEEFNSETLLHSFGYNVGVSGKSKKERQKLLQLLYEKNILSIAEMKATINQSITMFSHRKSYNAAISDWKDDLKFLNSLNHKKTIKNKRLIK